MSTNTMKQDRPFADVHWMRSDLFRQLIIIFAVVITIFVNALATSLPLNNQTTGEISDRFPTLFVPAGYVFSIWGVIYLGLIAYAVYQALPSQRTNPTLRAIGGWFLLSSLANSLWIFCWHYNQFGLSLALMIVLLISLIMIYRRLAADNGLISRAARWCVYVPFSIYLAWVCVATIPNTSTVLYLANWDGWGISAPIWAVIMLGVATLLGLAFSFVRVDIAYVLVLVWAFAGIAVKQWPTPVVAVSAIVAAVIVGGSLLVSLPRRYKVRTDGSISF